MDKNNLVRVQVLVTVLTVVALAITLFFMSVVGSKDTMQHSPVQTATESVVVIPSPTPTPVTVDCPDLQKKSVIFAEGQILLAAQDTCKQLVVHLHYHHLPNKDEDVYWKVLAEYSKVPLNVHLESSDRTLWIMVSNRGFEQFTPGVYVLDKPRYDPGVRETVPGDPPESLYPPGWQAPSSLGSLLFELGKVWWLWPGFRFFGALIPLTFLMMEFYRRMTRVSTKLSWRPIWICLILSGILLISSLNWIGDVFTALFHLFGSIPIQQPVPLNP